MINRLIATSTLAVIATLSLSVDAFSAERKVIIGFHKSPGTSERNLIEGRHGRIKKEYKHVHAVSVDIDESELVKLRSDPDVAYVEDDVMVQAIDPLSGSSITSNALANTIEYDNSWSVPHIGADILHGESITGAGVKIAILDTGIDYNHTDLDLNFAGGDNFISLDPNNHDPADDSYNSHGTHVAGIIAAELDGVGAVGVAPDASLYAAKVLDGAGFGSVSTIVAGIDWAIANQVHVINMSMGLSTYSQALADACAAAEAAGIVLIAAAGNTYGGPVLYPAALSSVIAVGATTIFDEISPISPVGPEVEMVAPGLNVYSTTVGGGYGFLGGTSQSAPHVSGLVALIMSASLVEDMDGNGVVDNHDIRLLLRDNTIDLGTAGFDDTYGYGLISASKLFDGSGGMPQITHLTIEKSKDSSCHNHQSATIEDGVFDVTIANTSLRALKVKIFEGSNFRHDLSKKFKFHHDATQEVSFTIDASGTMLKLVFKPKGKPGAFADVYIQQQ